MPDKQQLNPVPAEGDLNAYLREIRRYPRLTPEEEKALARRCAAGEPEAIRTMVSCNLPLAYALAKEYAGRGVPLMDLVQEGSIGLMVAARKFDPELDYRFSTYATKWIRQGITRSLMNHAGLIRVPVHTAEKMRRLLTAKAAFQQRNGREPTPEELSPEVGIPPEKVRKLLLLTPEICSLDAPTGEDGDSTLASLLPDSAAQDPQALLMQAQLLELTHALLSRLTERQQTILRLHYGMEDGICHSLEDIAGKLGISKERARQVEKQAFEKLKTLGTDLGLEDFLED